MVSMLSVVLVTSHVELFWFLWELICMAQLIPSSHAGEFDNTSFPLDPDSTDISPEKLLIQHLLRGYERVGRNGRPVVNITTTVPVTFGLGLIQMDLDEKNKVLTLSAWTRYTWRDRYLMWYPSRYEGIGAVRMDPSLVWIPDIMLYNTADVDVASRQAQVIITSDGTVSWYPHTIFRSSCSIDVTNFPFDYQQCHMWFGSWTYSSKELDLSMAFPGGIDLTTFQTDYKETCAWNIINTTSERKVLPTETAEPNFIVLTFDIFMSRKMVFSSYILTLPCVFLACITLVVFWLPPERPDRTSLAMSAFSSFMVLLLILVEACPATASSVPTIGIYYCFNMVIIMLSIILSSLVVNLSRGGSHRVPKWIRITVGTILGRIVFLHSYSPPAWRGRRSKPDKTQDHAELNPIHDTSSHDGHHTYVSDQLFRHTQSQTGLGATTSGNGGGGGGGNGSGGGGHTTCSCLTTNRHLLVGDMEGQIAEMRKVLQRIEMKMDDELRRKLTIREIAAEWRYLALVLDRLFFCIYISLIVVSLCVLFPRTSH